MIYDDKIQFSTLSEIGMEAPFGKQLPLGADEKYKTYLTKQEKNWLFRSPPVTESPVCNAIEDTIAPVDDLLTKLFAPVERWAQKPGRTFDEFMMDQVKRVSNAVKAFGKLFTKDKTVSESNK